MTILARRLVIGPLLLVGLVSASSATGSNLVISQVYGGGGNSGAPYRNDFVELFNRGTNVVAFTNWSVQYASAAGGNWQVTVIRGAISPGGYFLVQQGSGGTNGATPPTPDATGSISMSGSAGKVALVEEVAALTTSCPALSNILDFVGYGSTANCFEGGGPAPNPGNATAALRASGGCADTDANAADFFATAPAPRNSSTPANVCPSRPPVSVPLHAIQGAGLSSPLAGQFILTTANIVTARMDDGFFLQAHDDETDGDANTSEAVFVATPAGLPASASAGNAVTVAGIVVEQRPPGDPGGPPRTQIINATVTLVSSGNSLPAPSVIAAADASPAGSLDQLERFENMRVRVNSLTVVGPTEGFLIESSASGISDGVFHGVVTGVPRPFREPGISILDPLPPEAPAGVPRFDANPERLRVDANAQPGAVRLEVTTGAVVSNLVGVLDFQLRQFTILPDASPPVAITGNRGAIPVPVAASNELTLAALNLQRFYDTADDPAVDDVVLTTSAFEARLTKASLAIRNVLRSPDILGVIEMENLATLQTLAVRLNADAAGAGQPSPGYAGFLAEGNDVGGIDVGFLVKASRVSVLEVTQLGKTATYVNPVTGLPETLHDRPPLLLRASVARPGAATPFEMTVILVHLRSLLNVDDPVDGPRVRAKRQAQAEFVANFIQQRQTTNPSERIACLGDFNAFPFNDGYVDVLGTITGQPALSNEVTLAGADLVNPDLANLLDGLPAGERYSYAIDGNAQALDHLLINAPLQPHFSRFAYARGNADFPESYRSNPNRPERISDHDAPVGFFALTLAPRMKSIERTSSGAVALEWSAEPGQTNVVQASLNLTDWNGIGSALADNAGNASFTDTNAATMPQRFYRLFEP